MCSSDLLGDYHTTQKVFGVRHSPETSFSKAFANKFRLPKISRCPNTALKVEVVEMDTKMFDWAFTPTNGYIVYEYLGGFYLYGLHILPIFSPNTLQPLSVPPLGDELQSFVNIVLQFIDCSQYFTGNMEMESNFKIKCTCWKD